MAFNVAFDQLRDQCDYFALFDIDSLPTFHLSEYAAPPLVTASARTSPTTYPTLDDQARPAGLRRCAISS
jgi:hypothetical protein